MREPRLSGIRALPPEAGATPSVLALFCIDTFDTATFRRGSESGKTRNRPGSANKPPVEQLVEYDTNSRRSQTDDCTP